jgi:carboxylesterase
MKFLVRSASACLARARHPLRRVLLLAALVLLTGGIVFGIGQLQAFQSMPAAKPYYHAGDRTGVLLLHGFGGSPAEVQPLAESLAVNGHTVSAPLLPGHGTTPRDFAVTTNPQYLAAVRQELDCLRQQCDRVYVIGFSMGGLLAIQLEQEFALDGLVLMSAPIQPWHDRADFHWLKRAAESGAKINLFVPTFGIPTLIQSVRRERGNDPSDGIEPTYAAYPAASCLEVLELIEQVKPELPAVATPTLILHSRDDYVSAPSSAQYLYEHLGSREKRLVYLDRSAHVIALGPERERIQELVGRFVESGSLE